MPPKGSGGAGRKRGRPRQIGILGVALAGSSDDEDYRPSGGGARQRRRPADSNESGEDVPLAQRRRQLQRQQLGVKGRGAAAAAGSSAADAAAAAGPPIDLPVEVLCKILRLACSPGAGGAIPTAAAAMCVSRSWRAAAEACPDLWRHVNLSWRRCRPSDAALARAAPRWAQLRWLSLSGVAGVSDAGLQTIAACCPRLSSLALAHCAQFTDRGLTAALATMLLRPAAADGSTAPLRRLDLSFTQISPKVSGLDQVVREVLAVQARNPSGPILEELEVEGCPLLSHHGLRAVTEASVEAGRPLLAALRVLNLTQSAGARSDFVLNIERLQYSCPALQRLCLNGLCGASGWTWNASPSSLPQGACPPAFPALTHCQVAAKSNPDMAGLGTGATNVNDACLTRLLARSPLLEQLDVSGCERLSPNCLATAVHPAAPLREALLARSGACCDEAVAFLVDRFGQTLEAVDLSWGGARISDAAAAALARCPRLHVTGLAGTAVTTEGVRQLLLASDRHRHSGHSSGSGRAGDKPIPPLRLDVSSCRGLDRAVRQAATTDGVKLRAALGLPP